MAFTENFRNLVGKGCIISYCIYMYAGFIFGGGVGGYTFTLSLWD
jgi:hypothetical protein